MSVVNVSVIQPHYIEGSRCHSDPGAKPAGLTLRFSNRVSSEEQVGEDLENEPESVVIRTEQREVQPPKMGFWAHYANPPPVLPLFLSHSVLDFQ